MHATSAAVKPESAGIADDGRMPRSLKAYDHRLREPVQRTRDVSLATSIGVPRTSATAFLGDTPALMVRRSHLVRGARGGPFPDPEGDQPGGLWTSLRCRASWDARSPQGWSWIWHRLSDALLAAWNGGNLGF